MYGCRSLRHPAAPVHVCRAPFCLPGMLPPRHRNSCGINARCRRAGPRGLPTRAAGPQCAKAVSATVPTAADSNCSGVGSERRSVVWAEPSRNGPQTAQTGRLPGPQVANNELLAPSRRRVVWPAGWGCGHACAVSGERTRAPPHGVYGPLRRRVLCARAGGTTRCSRFQQTRRLSADLRPGQAPRLPRLRPVP